MFFLKKKNYIHIVILSSIYLILLLLSSRFKYILGSSVDWQNQHWIIPEYFRNLFYSTHDLFPDFALNIGAGQNIYNLSYYGFLSPIVFFSYLFPFIDMMHYIIIISCINAILSIILVYLFLLSNKYSSEISFIVAFMFLCSAPLMFHSKMHIMFVNYFPFLLLALFGADRLLNKGKSDLLIISCFLIIMTSYFFSVGSYLTIVVYYTYKYLKSIQKVRFKDIVLKLIRLCAPMIIAILMSAILILPTLYAITTGRKNFNTFTHSFNFNILFPSFDLSALLYNPYGLGYTGIALVGVLYGFFIKKKEIRFLSVIMSLICVFPIISYIFNGTLYVDTKVFIPFTFIMCIVIAEYLKNLYVTKKYIRSIVYIIIPIITIALLNMDGLKKLFCLVFVVDVFSLLYCVIKYCVTGIKKYMYIEIFIVSLLTLTVSNLSLKMLDKSYYKNAFSEDTEKLISSVIDNDNEFCRFSNNMYPLSTVNKVYSTKYYNTTIYSSVYNKYYNNFYYKIFNNEINFRNSVITNATENILFNMFIGNKYLITDKNPPFGYTLAETNGVTSIYKTDLAFPLGYSTSNIIDEAQYQKLSYPQNIEALVSCTVSKNFSNSEFVSEIKEYNPSIKDIKYENIDIKVKDGIYYIDAKKDARITINFDKPLVDKILFIDFDVILKNNKNDLSITINDIRNKITSYDWKYANNNDVFDYVLSSSSSIDKLDIKLTKGKYCIQNIKTFALDKQCLFKYKNSIDEFKIDMDKTKGDIITGSVNVSDDGYFVLNIPYDEGFDIKVNSQKVDYEIVNEAFIGFPVSKGLKQIEITYTAPYKKIATRISIIGFIIAFIFVISEYIISNKKKNHIK